MSTQNHNRHVRNPRKAGRKALPYGEKKQKVWTSLPNKIVCTLEDSLQPKGKEVVQTVSEYIAHATMERMRQDGILQQ